MKTVALRAIWSKIKQHPDYVVLILGAVAIFYSGMRYQLRKLEPHMRRQAVVTIQEMYKDGKAPEPVVFDPGNREFQKDLLRNFRGFVGASYSKDGFGVAPGVQLFRTDNWTGEILVPLDIDEGEIRGARVEAHVRYYF